MAAARRARGPFVSRAGLKLDHALRSLEIPIDGLVCADFGCNVGGFTDCLLQRGASLVYAVDTGYGTLDYTLRTDPRVVVMERTNALRAEPPTGGVDLVCIDLAWTRQRRAIPAALRWLRDDGRLITLVKPHYELETEERATKLAKGRLDPAEAARVLDRVLEAMPDLGARPLAHVISPIRGGKTSRGGEGNVEYLVLARPKTPGSPAINRAFDERQP